MNRHFTLLTTWFCLLAVLGGCRRTEKPTVPTAENTNESAPTTEETAPAHAVVTAFISARCPHAAQAMKSLLLLREEMGDALELHIGYVGATDAEGKIDRAVGDDEIQAAVRQVCTGMAATESSWFAYLNCLYKGDTWRLQPQGTNGCLEQVGIDRSAVDACAASGEGEAVLAQAYGAAAASRIQASPTIIINNHLYGGPRTAEELRRYICYTAGTEATRPPICDTVPPPAKIEAVMLYDRRCNSAVKCDVEGEIAVLEKLIPGFSLTRTEFSTEEGRALYERILSATPDFNKLPVIFIDGAVDDSSAIREMLGEYLLPFEDGYMFALGGGWDPLEEICDNGVDDNGNGTVDCDDAYCSAERICREAQPGRLDLFVMSECPYALDILPRADRLLAHFDRDRAALDFHLQFIGAVGEDGVPVSMHGESEVAEDKRMLCAQSLYPKRYKFMEYVVCRAEAFESTDWKACVPKGMNAAKIERCAEGGDGEALLKESFALADSLGVTGSPSWILNNKQDMNARILPDMIVSFCGANKRAACEKPVQPLKSSADDADNPLPPGRCN